MRYAQHGNSPSSWKWISDAAWGALDRWVITSEHLLTVYQQLVRACRRKSFLVYISTKKIRRVSPTEAEIIKITVRLLRYLTWNAFSGRSSWCALKGSWSFTSLCGSVDKTSADGTTANIVTGCRRSRIVLEDTLLENDYNLELMVHIERCFVVPPSAQFVSSTLLIHF